MGESEGRDKQEVSYLQHLPFSLIFLLVLGHSFKAIHIKMTASTLEIHLY